MTTKSKQSKPAPASTKATPDFSRASLLRLPEVMAITRRSRPMIYRDPSFPKPVKIGKRAVAWIAEEIEAWKAQRIAERDRKFPA